MLKPGDAPHTPDVYPPLPSGGDGSETEVLDSEVPSGCPLQESMNAPLLPLVTSQAL